jgi:hypothetical protein
VIESYSFGRIKIKGRTYTSDVIVFPNRVLADWWRKEGHSLDVDDLQEVFSQSPRYLVVGLGASSCMRIPPSTREELHKRGIDLIALDTSAACEKFNELLRAGKDVVAALHLTC